MDSETQIGPLTLLRARDWVSPQEMPSRRYYIHGKARTYLGEGVECILDSDTIIRRYVPFEAFKTGQWVVVEPNPDVSATILGAYNKPEVK